MMVGWAGCALLVVLPAGGLAAAGVDYADSRQAGLWLQHPVYGGPSFDTFVHAPLFHAPALHPRTRRVQPKRTIFLLASRPPICHHYCRFIGKRR